MDHNTVENAIRRMEYAVECDPERGANLRGFLTRCPESKFYRAPPKRPGLEGYRGNDRPTDQEIIDRQWQGW